jgi:hypothetical protein
MNKIKFKDLVFEPHHSGLGIQAVMEFDNGYGVSVVFGDLFYSNGVDTYELAVLKDDAIDYENPVADGDVRGYLNKKKLMELINQVNEL